MDIMSSQVRPSLGRGERRSLTVLFTDLSGYSSLSKSFDPEDIKELMTAVFAVVNDVTTSYGGHIERYFGDEALALFGYPVSHEDDPVRAVKAAIGIRERVRALGASWKIRLPFPLEMHTGIAAGLVVTADEIVGNQSHGLTGEAVNMASHLADAARGGEILVSASIRQLSAGHFEFGPYLEAIGPEGVAAYRLLTEKDEPVSLRRLTGLRAELIGRDVEMDRLMSAVAELEDGKGGIITIRGEAGTGKSRLVAELKRCVDHERILWCKGRGYDFTRNIPYFMFIDFFNRAWGIKEGDTPEVVTEAIVANISRLLGPRAEAMAAIEGLYALAATETESLDPEFWKKRLHRNMTELLTAMARLRPTIVCFEDLHWADPSSVDLIRAVAAEVNYPMLLVCTYRPPFSLFTGQEQTGLGKSFNEISIASLSASEAQAMLRSLLRTETVPPELSLFVEEKVAGNPFYMEEMVNSLIETGILTSAPDGWRMTRQVTERDIPMTIQGVITARLDRLAPEVKRVVQEAAVVGRAFPREVLRRVSDHADVLDNCLDELERADLVRTRALFPEVEHAFKHPLTQDVVYGGLVAKDRREIHDRIARALEDNYQNRLSEFCEAIAFHYQRGASNAKAVDFLVRAGEKSLKRYSLEEAHGYYEQAFRMLAGDGPRSRAETDLLMDILLRWMVVYYYRGFFREMTELLEANRHLTSKLADNVRLGMYLNWLGMTMVQQERFAEARDILEKALAMGRQAADNAIIGHASAWSAYACADLGLLDEALEHGRRALRVSQADDTDHLLRQLALGSMGFTHWIRGDISEAAQVGRDLLEYGQAHSNIRCLVFGHWITGFSRLIDGDHLAAAESNRRAIGISADPWYAYFPKLHLGLALILDGRLDEASEPITKLVAFCERLGGEILGTPARGLLGALRMAEGRWKEGFKIFNDVRRRWEENKCRWRLANWEFILGMVYLGILRRDRPVTFSLLARNMGMVARKVPFAGKRAEKHLRRAAAVSEEIGAHGMLGDALYQLGNLCAFKGRKEEARRLYQRARQVLAARGAVHFLEVIDKAMASVS